MTVQSIATGVTVWLWEEYGKELVDKALGELKKAWAEVKWGEAAEKYRQRMGDLYGTIRVLGYPRPVPLEGLFTDVFILDKPTAFRRFDITQLRQDPSRLRKAKRIPGLRLVTQPEGQRLFILGKPGAGKTTFLKHLTQQAIEGKLDKIPIFVPLNEWADGWLDLLPYIVHQFEICAFPDARVFIEHILSRGEAIVLFDGLDEVSQEHGHRARTINILKDFSNQYLNSQCLITCRIAATDYAFDRFTYVELADFTDTQMRAYIGKWFKDSDTKRDKFLEDFFGKEEHHGLRELGRIPLLLSLLCIAFDETMSFPQRRVEIYEEALDALLKKWDSSRNIRRDQIYRCLSLGRKRQMFARIAAVTFEKGVYFLPQDDLEAHIEAYWQKLPPADVNDEIDSTAVLKAIESQHGIFVERAHRIYSFAHLTFQEYFTAKYIVDNARDGTLESLIYNHLIDDHWREVFLLTASLLDNADTFFDIFQQAVGKLVREDPILIQILQWAERKATVTNTVLNPLTIRSVYFCLALAHIDVPSCSLSDTLYTLACIYAHDLALRLAWELTHEGLGFTHPRNRKLDRVLAHARNLADNLAFECGYDSGSDTLPDFDVARKRNLDFEFVDEYDDSSDERDVASEDDLVPDEYKLARDYFLTRKHELAREYDHVRYSPGERDRDHDLVIPPDYHLVLDPSFDLDFSLSYNLALDLNLVLVVKFALTFGRSDDLDSLLHLLPAFTAYFNEVVAMCQHEDLLLRQTLAKLKVPAKGSTRSRWIEFAANVQEAMVTHRDLGYQWNLTDKQAERLSNYLRANRMLSECLALAVVSDRAKIESSLLLAPEG